MASDGFDIKELEAYEKKLLALANDKMPNESKKHLKNQSQKLSKKQKNQFKSVSIGETGEMEREVLKKFKSGKVYKRNGALQCRSFLGKAIKGYANGKYYSYGAMLNNGYVSRNPWTGEEFWVPGEMFIEKAEQSFQSEFYKDTQDFLDEMLDKGL